MMAKDFTLSSCFTLENIMNAANKCASSSSWKLESQKFMSRKPTECLRLRNEIISNQYKPTKTKRFRVIERGKPRDVLPLSFRDRVAQRCFVDNGFYSIFERTITPTTSACVKGRGLSYAYNCVRSFIASAPNDSWCLRYDFSGYFASIDRYKAYLFISKEMNPETKSFLLQSIGNIGSGLELGSHISQLIASAYPTNIDIKANSIPGVIGYHRYMDDGIVICKTKDIALKVLATIKTEANNLGLSINEKKTSITALISPVIFCKMRFTKCENKCRMNVRKQQTRRSIKHAKEVKKRSDRVNGIDMSPVRASLLGYINRGDVDLSRLLEEI